jgi:hypothetical protein
LHEATIRRLDDFSIAGHSVGHAGVNDCVAKIEWFLAGHLERWVHAQHGAGGAVGAVVAAFRADVHQLASPFLANSGLGWMPDLSVVVCTRVNGLEPVPWSVSWAVSLWLIVSSLHRFLEGYGLPDCASPKHTTLHTTQA